MGGLELADDLLGPIHQRITGLTIHIVEITVDHVKAVIAAQLVLIPRHKVPIKRV